MFSKIILPSLILFSKTLNLLKILLLLFVFSNSKLTMMLSLYFSEPNGKYTLSNLISILRLSFCKT